MKGLRKFLTPFAPDQSGAVSVLYELGGIIVIVDAGGCAGNICGFDEPRWSETRSAIFSAGLRDMDAIMGRDKLLVKKIADAAGKIRANFVALVGTPVPAVIGTDYKALKKMLSKETSLPVVTVDTDGMHLFDSGEEKAYVALLKELKDMDLFNYYPLTQESDGEVNSAENEKSASKGTIQCDNSTETNLVLRNSVGIFGATPLDLYSQDGKKIIADALKKEGYDDVIFYGNGAAFGDFQNTALNKINIAVSPSGVKAVKLLHEYFGTPFEVRFPGTDELIGNHLEKANGSIQGGGQLNTSSVIVQNAQKILIVHSQIFANSIREVIKKINPEEKVTVASWFSMLDEYMEDGDVRLKEEDDFIVLAAGGFDLIVGDEILKKMLPDYHGEFINIPEFSISGKKKAGI